MSIQGNVTSIITNLFTRVNLENVLVALIVVVLGFLVGYALRLLVYRGSMRLMPAYIANAVSKTLYYVIVSLAVIVALGALGIDLTGFIIAGGILGIILGFALQSTVANFVSGLFLYWERPFKPGDLVEVEGVVGRVLEVSVLSTTIIGLDGVVVRVPNDKVFTSMIRNFIRNPIRRIEFVIGIAYREDAEKAYNVIRNVLEEHPLVLVNPPPETFVSELGDSSVNITVRAWVPSQEYLNVRRELLWSIKKALTGAGIEIPFPQHDVWFRSPLEVRLSK